MRPHSIGLAKAKLAWRNWKPQFSSLAPFTLLPPFFATLLPLFALSPAFKALPAVDNHSLALFLKTPLLADRTDTFLPTNPFGKSRCCGKQTKAPAADRTQQNDM